MRGIARRGLNSSVGWFRPPRSLFPDLRQHLGPPRMVLCLLTVAQLLVGLGEESVQVRSVGLDFYRLLQRLDGLLRLPQPQFAKAQLHPVVGGSAHLEDLTLITRDGSEPLHPTGDEVLIV